MVAKGRQHVLWKFTVHKERILPHFSQWLNSMCHWRSGKEFSQGTKSKNIHILDSLEPWGACGNVVQDYPRSTGPGHKRSSQLILSAVCLPQRRGKDSHRVHTWEFTHPFQPVVYNSALIADGVGGRARGCKWGRMREWDSVSAQRSSHHPCWVQTIYTGCFTVTYTAAPNTFILINKAY